LRRRGHPNRRSCPAVELPAKLETALISDGIRGVSFFRSLALLFMRFVRQARLLQALLAVPAADQFSHCMRRQPCANCQIDGEKQPSRLALPRMPDGGAQQVCLSDRLAIMLLR